MATIGGGTMTDKQIIVVFRKISLTKIVVLFLEFWLFYALFSNNTQLALLVLSAFVILLNTILIGLWEGVNKERVNEYDR